MNLTPQYRIEEYLEAIVEGWAEATQYPYPDYPSWRIEEFLDAFITYIWEDGDHPRHPCPDPVWHIEECLRAIYDVMTGAATPWAFPTPPTNRIEEYLAAIHAYLADGTELPVPEPVWHIEQWLAYVLDAVKQGGGVTKTVSGSPAHITDALAKAALSVLASIEPTQDLHGYSKPWIGTDYDEQPYNFRAVSSSSISPLGNSEMGNIVGGTVAWNQLIGNYYESNCTKSVSGGIVTVTPTASGNRLIGTKDNQTVQTKLPNGHKGFISVVIKSDGEHDVGFQNYLATGTKKANSESFVTITDIVSSLSNSSLIQLWSPSQTAYQIKDGSFMCIDLTAMFGSTIADYLYTLESGTAGAGVAKLKSWGFCTKPYYAYDAGSLLSVNTSAHKTYKADSTLLGNYVLDSDLELRGIPKLDANNNLYYDGDSYEADGTVTRKYATRAYAEGDATDGSTMITDGTNTVYKLNTPTTESADPYTATQSIDPYGTEEYVDYAESQGTRDVAIPVGHYTNYANICPISGRTGLSVYRRGKNLLNTATNVTGYYINGSGVITQDSGTPSSQYTDLIPVEVGKKYTLSLISNRTNSGNNRVHGYDSNGNWVQEITHAAPTTGSDVPFKLTGTIYSGISYVRISYGINDVEAMYEKGNEQTFYEPFAYNTYDEDWSAQAGTVYGGTLDVVTGVLTVDRANIASYNGETINEPWLSSMDEYAPGATPTTGAQVVYTLATPLTYQLTAQEVQMLLGENYVWSSSGDTVSVTYYAAQ